jgi:hypothetical protein
MKVKVLKQFDKHKIGQEIDLPDNVARLMIKFGAVAEVEVIQMKTAAPVKIKLESNPGKKPPKVAKPKPKTKAAPKNKK